jgi:epoxyqueuosine reductase
MGNIKETNYDLIAEASFGLGFDLFGTAALPDLEKLALDLSPETTGKLQTGIALGVFLSGGVLEDIAGHPTRLYLHHYRQANYFLDRNAFELARRIELMGAAALAVGASQTVDWTVQRGHLSHKEVARRAGLGWIGRNNLLVTPRRGSRVRLVTVLTDLPLTTGRPLKRDCGDCRDCIEACPAGAIRVDPADFDHLRCYEQLKVFKNSLNLGHYICGVCVKACRGKKKVIGKR